MWLEVSIKFQLHRFSFHNNEMQILRHRFPRGGSACNTFTLDLLGKPNYTHGGGGGGGGGSDYVFHKCISC